MARHSDAPEPDDVPVEASVAEPVNPPAAGASGPSARDDAPLAGASGAAATDVLVDAPSAAAPASDPVDDPVDDSDGAPDHDVRAVLRITAFRRLWLALGLSSFGDWLGLLATAALANTLAAGSYTAQSFAIAGVFILRLAPAVVLGPVAGALADKLNRRWTLVLGDLLRFVLFASIPIVGTLTWLYVATVLIEIVALFWMPAKDATVPNLVPRRRLEAANQISLVATYGSAPLAALVYSGLALLTGILDNWVDALAANPVTLALWFNAITFLVSGLTIWRLQIPPRTSSANAQASVLGLIVDGWRYVGSTPVVRGLVLGMLGAFAAGGLVVGLAQTFVTDLGAGQPGFGVLFGAVFVGLALGMWVGPRLLVDLSRRRLFGLALTAAGVFLVLLAAVPNIVMAALFTTAVGACGGIAWVTGYTLLGLEVDDEVRGRTFGFLQSAARVVLVGVLALGPALAAPIGRHTFSFTDYFSLTYNGAAWVFLLAGVLAFVMGITSYRQMDDRRGTPLVTDLRRAWSARSEGPRPPRRTAPGFFIAFEGGDGAGKSTQAKALAQWLRDEQGHEVVLTREPGATPVGVRLRDVLLGHEHTVGSRAEALLFAADRAHHVASVVRPALERGAVVVTDRYVDSSIAYQGAGRDLDPDDVARLSRWATDGLAPDLTVLLDLPPQISRVRRRRDTERAEGDDAIEVESDAFHERVRERFLDLARREPHRYLVLDASEARDDLQAAIRARLRDVVPVSVAKRAELAAKLAEEERARARKAAAEAEVLRMDALLRGRQRDEALAREQAARRAREEAERDLSDDGVDRSDAVTAGAVGTDADVAPAGPTAGDLPGGSDAVAVPAEAPRSWSPLPSSPGAGAGEPSGWPPLSPSVSTSVEPSAPPGLPPSSPSGLPGHEPGHASALAGVPGAVAPTTTRADLPTVEVRPDPPSPDLPSRRPADGPVLVTRPPDEVLRRGRSRAARASRPAGSVPDVAGRVLGRLRRPTQPRPPAAGRPVTPPAPGVSDPPTMIEATRVDLTAVADPAAPPTAPAVDPLTGRPVDPRAGYRGPDAPTGVIDLSDELFGRPEDGR